MNDRLCLAVRAATVLGLLAAASSVRAQVPVIDSFNPTLGPAGTSVVVKGSHFTGATFMGIGESGGTFTVDSDTQITFSVAAGSKTNRLKVITPTGSGFSAGFFVVGTSYPVPTITSFNPTSGGPGTSVLITGTGLATATSVLFNGAQASFTIRSDAYITTSVPAGATNGPIYIVTLGGKCSSGTPFIVGGSTTPPPPPNTAPPAHVAPPSTAVLTHPRIWIRQQDLPRLRSWATNTKNKIFADLKNVAIYYRNRMDQGIVPGQDNGEGDNDNIPNPSEEYAETFALMSLIDPNVAARADWTKRAHDLIMYVLNQAVLGPAANTPFRTPHFATYDRSRWFGEAFPLVVDWCYSSFTTAEKRTIRKVFMRWCNELQDNNLGYSPSPPGAYNQPSILLQKHNIRWSGNNYVACHARNLTMLALALDPADDVADPNNPQIAGDRDFYLTDYIGAVMGEWLLIRNHAEMHDLKGGLGIEGPLYSESTLAAYSQLLLSLHTAGYDTPQAVTIYGPQAAFGQNSFWTNDVMAAYCHSMSPALHQLATWWPPQFLPASFGDCLRFDDEDMISSFAPLAAIDLVDGNTSAFRLNAIRWMETVIPAGGWATIDQRLTSSPWNYGSLLPIMYFLMFDPALTNSAGVPVVNDPRSWFGLDYVSPGLNRILSRTDWTANATWFAFISTWSNTDHQWEDSNSFSFYRKGEFLTKEWTGYGMNIRCTDYNNNLSIHNPPLGSNALSYSVQQGAHGSQYSYVSDGDPVVKTSLNTSYVFGEGDATKRYNTTPFGASDVAHASRSIFWIKPDFVVIYDRATSLSQGKFKRVTFNSVTQPAVNGHSAVAVTPNGQSLFLTNLLPAGATLSWDMPSTTWDYQEAADYEINRFRIIVEDLSKPMDARYLNVLQGADKNAVKSPVTGFASSSGSPYDGAWFSNTAVLIARNLNQSFTGVTYSVPASTTKHYVTGLNPGGTYTATITPAGANIQVSITAGGNKTADSAGVLAF